MTSAAKIAANQRNAAQSTGPKSEAGKAASSKNASKHGLTSQENIILPGQESAFADLEAGLRRDLNPQGTIQLVLFDVIVHAAWNVRRCRQFLAQLQLEAHDPNIDVLHDDGQSDRLHRVEMYRRRHESSFHRSMKELRTLQQEAAYREATGFLEPLSVLINTHRLPIATQPEETAPPAEAEAEPEPAPKPRKPAKPIDLPPFVAAQLANYPFARGRVPSRTRRSLGEGGQVPPAVRYPARRP